MNGGEERRGEDEKWRREKEARRREGEVEWRRRGKDRGTELLLSDAGSGNPDRRPAAL